MAPAAEGPAQPPPADRPLVALLVNPVAGVGGRAGLKGSDDGEAVRRLLEEDRAEPVAPDRALRFLRRFQKAAAAPAGAAGADDGAPVDDADSAPADAPTVAWRTCPAPMGADVLDRAGVEGAEVLDAELPDPTTAEDTRRLLPDLVQGADLLVVVGGDGTMVDVLGGLRALEAAGRAGDLPVLGVPAGVKMHSACFAQDPDAAADVLSAWLAGDADVVEAEVLDADEDRVRAGRLKLDRAGLLLTLDHPLRVPGKDEGPADDEARRALAGALLDRVAEGRWVLGPGSTVLAVKEALGIDGTPLGVDLVEGGRLVGKDVDEAACLEHAEGAGAGTGAESGEGSGAGSGAESEEGSGARGTRILVTPIGGQGVVLGRGNQPISAGVVRACGGPEAVVVCATPAKHARLNALRFDTGDPGLDAAFGDHLRVVSGPQREKVMRVRRGPA